MDIVSSAFAKIQLIWANFVYETGTVHDLYHNPNRKHQLPVPPGVNASEDAKAKYFNDLELSCCEGWDELIRRTSRKNQ